MFTSEQRQPGAGCCWSCHWRLQGALPFPVASSELTNCLALLTPASSLSSAWLRALPVQSAAVCLPGLSQAPGSPWSYFYVSHLLWAFILAEKCCWHLGKGDSGRRSTQSCSLKAEWGFSARICGAEGSPQAPETHQEHSHKLRSSLGFISMQRISPVIVL